MTLTTLTAALVAATLALSAAPASAHSTKEATHPADGAVMAATPERVAMTFDMPMRVTLITLTDQNGAAHALTRSDNMQPVTDFSAEPPALPAGQYRVDWRGLADDGHAMQGTFGFEITN